MRTLPLKYQLLLVNIATTGAVILIALGLMYTAEVRIWKEALVRDIAIKADIIGNQCTAALTFNALKDAEEILGALRADAQIRYAALYTRKENLFAAYRRNAEEQLPRTPPAIGHRFEMDYLDLTHPVNLHDEQIGIITIRVGLEGLHEVLVKYVTVSAGVLVFALAAASALLLRLQRTISGPLGKLVDLMERVSVDKDYTRRAVEQGPQELVSLSGSFNEMLTAIQTRDHDLERSLADLQNANRKLEKLDRLKSDFISMVSHELRTPITSIKAFVEILLMKPDIPEERKTRILNSISMESERFVRLVNDLLDISRIEAGVMNWRFQDVDVADVVKSASTAILPLAQQKAIIVEEKIASDLGILKGDSDRIMQLIMNLLSNAVKFTPQGGNVSVSAVRDDPASRIVVSVSDTGPGISPEDRERIFEKFHRSGDMLTNTVEGTGLGLAIARQIVQHYGGRIWVADEERAGSTFIFTLPLAPGEPSQDGNGT